MSHLKILMLVTGILFHGKTFEAERHVLEDHRAEI
jgi:hypothetical protein